MVTIILTSFEANVRCSTSCKVTQSRFVAKKKCLKRERSERGRKRAEVTIALAVGRVLLIMPAAQVHAVSSTLRIAGQSHGLEALASVSDPFSPTAARVLERVTYSIEAKAACRRLLSPDPRGADAPGRSFDKSRSDKETLAAHL